MGRTRHLSMWIVLWLEWLLWGKYVIRVRMCEGIGGLGVGVRAGGGV
nr:MAG TPA: hypothetical protein [Caudoviricetes sp.]